jgi:hypothetical protein
MKHGRFEAKGLAPNLREMNGSDTLSMAAMPCVLSEQKLPLASIVWEA